MHSVIELAECRRHDLLAEAARERRAKEARSDQFPALPDPEILANAVRVARSTTRGAVVTLAFHLFERGRMRREQTMLPSPR